MDAYSISSPFSAYVQGWYILICARKLMTEENSTNGSKDPPPKFLLCLWYFFEELWLQQNAAVQSTSSQWTRKPIKSVTTGKLYYIVSSILNNLNCLHHPEHLWYPFYHSIISKKRSKILFSPLCLFCSPNLVSFKPGQKNVAYCLQTHY